MPKAICQLDENTTVDRITRRDAVNDLAVLTTKVSTAVRPATVRQSGLRVGDQIAVFGYPLAGTLSTSGSLTSGDISSLAGISDDTFNEFYFRRAICRAIIFRATEKMVSDQSWYNGGYRANIVAYSIAALSEICRKEKKSIDYATIWSTQTVPDGLLSALAVAARFVNDDITSPPQGISNISEWAKRDACWTRLKEKLDALGPLLPPSFWSELISNDEVKAEKKDARRVQKQDNGISNQMKVVEIGGSGWGRILREGTRLQILTPKESSLLRIASLIPAKLPNEKQSADLVEILDKAAREGITPS